MTSHKQYLFLVLGVVVALLCCVTASAASYLDVSRTVRVGLTKLGKPSSFVIEPSTGFIEIFDSEKRESVYSGKAARISINLLKDRKVKLAIDERKTFYFAQSELLFSAVGRLPINLKIRGGNGKSFAYRGTIAIAPVQGGLEVVNVIDMEEYLKSVVPCEISSRAPDSAMEAQTIAARTYAARHINRHNKNDRYQICDTVHCQVYTGIVKENSRSSKAVKKTEGQILAYAGAPANTVYHANCGGYLISSKAAWAGSEIPYLISHYDGDGKNEPFCSFGKNIKNNKPTGKLPRPNPSLVIRKLPWNAKKLVSKNFGHRVGMCQDGAIGMSAIGYSARQILAFYYPGTKIETLHYAIPKIDLKPEPLQKPIVMAAAPIESRSGAERLLALEGPMNPTQISALIRADSPATNRRNNIIATLKEISNVKQGNTAAGIRKMFWNPANPGLSKNRSIF